MSRASHSNISLSSPLPRPNPACPSSSSRGPIHRHCIHNSHACSEPSLLCACESLLQTLSFLLPPSQTRPNPGLDDHCVKVGDGHVGKPGFATNNVRELLVRNLVLLCLGHVVALPKPTQNMGI